MFLEGIKIKTGIKAADAMTEKPIYLNSDISLKNCAEEMEKNHVGAILVKENGNVAGIITEQDIVRKALAKGINPLEKSVSDFMESNLTTITANTNIFEALLKMKDLNIRHLPVVDGKKLLGLLTLKDVLKIEPQLFELLVDKFELKEEERKPINKPGSNEGLCQTCGEYAEKLKPKDGVLVCSNCLKI